MSLSSSNQSILNNPDCTTKSQGSDKTKERTHTHKLRHEYTFFYFKGNSQLKTEKEYTEALHKIATFNTVEGFWTIYNHLIRPENLPVGCALHLFKENTRPLWEDNPEGGIFTINFSNKRHFDVNQKWENIILTFIGEQFGSASDYVYGISYLSKKSDDRFNIWTRNSSDEESKMKVAEKIKKIWGLPSTENFEYQSNASKTNT